MITGARSNSQSPGGHMATADLRSASVPVACGQRANDDFNSVSLTSFFRKDLKEV